jgi:hypothetical protein
MNDMRTCPQCNQSISIYAKRCKNCGTKLDPAGETPISGSTPCLAPGEKLSSLITGKTPVLPASDDPEDSGLFSSVGNAKSSPPSAPDNTDFDGHLWPIPNSRDSDASNTANSDASKSDNQATISLKAPDPDKTVEYLEVGSKPASPDATISIELIDVPSSPDKTVEYREVEPNDDDDDGGDDDSDDDGGEEEK